MTYSQIQDNQWVTPIPKGYRFICCDCGLTHEMDFRIHKGSIQFRGKRIKINYSMLRHNCKKCGKACYGYLCSKCRGKDKAKAVSHKGRKWKG